VPGIMRCEAFVDISQVILNLRLEVGCQVLQILQPLGAIEEVLHDVALVLVGHERNDLVLVHLEEAVLHLHEHCQAPHVSRLYGVIDVRLFYQCNQPLVDAARVHRS